MQKYWKAFGFLSLLELGICLVVVTGAWAIAYHDLETLNHSALEGRDRLPELIMLGVLGLAMAANVIMFLIILAKGQKSVAIVVALFTAGLALLALSPMYVTVLGAGAVGGGFVAYLVLRTVLKALWRVVSWPFRRIARLFRRKAPEAAAPAAAPKKAASASAPKKP